MADLLQHYSHLKSQLALYKKIERLSESLPEVDAADSSDTELPMFRPPQRRWTKDAIDRVIALYEQGMSMNAISKQTGYDDESIKRQLVKAGITIRPRPCKLTPDVIDEAIREHAKGVTWAELGRRYKVTGQAVAGAVRRMEENRSRG